VLSIDRTEWQFGVVIFNILMLKLVRMGGLTFLWYVYLDRRIPIVLNTEVVQPDYRRLVNEKLPASQPEFAWAKNWFGYHLQ